MAEWLLYENDDGRHAVAPSAEAATFAHGDPAWHRVGPVEVPDESRDDDLHDAASRKLQAGVPLSKEEANVYMAASLFNPTNQVYFRAGLIACREYMARFVEAQSPEIAASIRANWWPRLGKDYGPPRLMDWNELAEGSPDEGNFRVKKDEISPTLEALPIALQFLQQPPLDENGAFRMPLVCSRTGGVPASEQSRSQKLAAAGFTPRKTGKTAGGLMPEDDSGVRAGPPWCCEKGEALNVAMCPDCIEACEGYQRAMSPSGVPAAPAALPTDRLEQVIDAYLEDYEMVGEAEDGRDACHVPTEGERILIKDAILGLLANEEWDAEWGKLIEQRARALGVDLPDGGKTE